MCVIDRIFEWIFIVDYISRFIYIYIDKKVALTFKKILITAKIIQQFL